MDASPCDVQALLWNLGETINSFIAGGFWFWSQESFQFAFLFVLSNSYSDTLAPIFWLPDMKSLLTGKDPDAGKDWRQKKGVTKDDIVRWHHRLNGHESEQEIVEDRGAWHAAVHGVTKSWTWPSDWTTTISVQSTYNSHSFLFILGGHII